FWRRYSRRALDVRGWIDAVRRRLRPSAASADDLDIRRWHGRDVMLGNIRRFLDRGGRMFAVFTGGVSSYYNNAGQLARALENDSGLTERYFPRVAHTYPMNADRIELIGHVVRWADANFAAEV